jgi:hypothetical protein
MYDVFLAIVVILISARAITLEKRVWHDEFEPFKAPSPGWIWSLRSWHAWKAASSIAGPSCFLMGLFGLLGIAFEENIVLLSIAVGALFIGVGLMIIVVIFNRPKLIIPPPFRNQRGLWRQWREDGFVPPERKKKSK